MNEPETNEQTARSESQQRFDENVKLIEQAQTGAPPLFGPRVSEGKLEAANIYQLKTDADGRRRYVYDPEYRAQIDAMRVEGLGGALAPVVARKSDEPPIGSISDQIKSHGEK